MAGLASDLKEKDIVDIDPASVIVESVEEDPS